MQLAYLLVQVVAVDILYDYINAVRSVNRVVEAHDTVVVQTTQCHALFAQTVNAACVLI